MRKNRGLFIGRFQPFHIGHLRALKWILSQEDEVIIAIGSSQFSHTIRNPFTVGERIEMIWRVLKEEKLLDKVIITSVPDTNGVHSIWASMVLATCPSFDRVYTNDPLSRRLFREYNIIVKKIPFFEREKFTATLIREKIIRGEKWQHLVPKQVYEYILEINGDERLRELYGKKYDNYNQH